MIQFDRSSDTIIPMHSSDSVAATKSSDRPCVSLAILPVTRSYPGSLPKSKYPSEHPPVGSVMFQSESRKAHFSNHFVALGYRLTLLHAEDTRIPAEQSFYSTTTIYPSTPSQLRDAIQVRGNFTSPARILEIREAYRENSTTRPVNLSTRFAPLRHTLP